MLTGALTQSELAVVRDYIRLGSLVAVARARGRSVKTIEVQTRVAREKFGGVALVQLAVLVDRADSGQNAIESGVLP